MGLGFSRLPENIRVKLSENKQGEFWHTINEFGGIKQFSEVFEISSSKMYNWKNKDSYIPVQIVRKVFGSKNSEGITAYKGPGRSKPVKNPVFPLEIDNELLTRIKCSVNVSKTPIYQSKHGELVKRFQKLLGKYGEVPYKVYKRSSVYELRYPMYLHRIFEQMPYTEDFPAKVDEKGVVEDGYLGFKGEKVRVEDFDGKLYCREKALKLALEKGDDQRIKELTLEEIERVERLFNS